MPLPTSVRCPFFLMHSARMAEVLLSYKQVFLLRWQSVHLILLDQQKFCQFRAYKMLTITLTLTMCHDDHRWFVSKDGFSAILAN